MNNMSRNLPDLLKTVLLISALFINHHGWADQNKHRLPGMFYSVSDDVEIVKKKTFLLNTSEASGKDALFLDSINGTVIEEDSLAPSQKSRKQQNSNIHQEIQSKADALKGDIDLIFDYVHDHIEFLPESGFKKGALGAMVEGYGTSWDQAYLMFSLLLASGYEESDVEFVTGDILISADEFKSWWDINNTTALSVFNHLTEARRSYEFFTVDGSDDHNSDVREIKLSHCWLRVRLQDGNWYHFDAGFKRHQRTSKVLDVLTSLNYNTSDFLNNALAGSTRDSHALNGIDTSSLSDALNQLSTNLVSELKTNHINASINDVIGGSKIIPHDGSAVRQTELPYVVDTAETSSDLWDRGELWPRLIIDMDVNNDVQDTYQILKISTLLADPLVVHYNDNNLITLRIGGIGISPLQRQSASGHTISIEVILPFNGEGTNFKQNYNVRPGGVYAIVDGWGPGSRNLFERYRERVAQNTQNGVDVNSIESIRASLAMFSSGYLAQGSRIIEMLETITQSKAYQHHQVGLAALTDAAYIDLPSIYTSVLSDADVLETSLPAFQTMAGFFSGLESTVLEQMLQVDSVSTVSLFDFTTKQDESKNSFFDVKCDRLNEAQDSCLDKTTYNQQIKPELSDYSEASFSEIESYIDQGYRLVLPRSGSLGENDWGGYAFIGSQLGETSASITYKIGNGIVTAKGGFAAEDVPREAVPNLMRWTMPWDQKDDRSLFNDNFTVDPVSWQTGDFVLDRSDMAVGHGEFPFAFGFSRFYTSGARLRNGSLGWGWNHSFNITAEHHSDGFQGLGEDSVIDAVAAITAMHVSHDLMKSEYSMENIVVMTLTQHWLMEQLTDNVVMVAQPGKGETFVKLPDGSYNPSPGSIATIRELPDDLLLYETNDGTQLYFNSEGKIKQDRRRTRENLNYIYSDGKLSRVENTFGDKLLFYYTDENLTSVEDHKSGRKVFYSYSDDGNLETFTDEAGSVYRYEYSQPGVMTRFYNPEFPDTPVATNVYDATFAVQQQTNAVGGVYQYFFGVHRSEEINPLGVSTVKYFDSKGLETVSIDGDGNQTEHQYDVHQRRVKTIYPEGNSVTTRFDERHNPVQVIVGPKPCNTQQCVTPDSLITTYTYEGSFNSAINALNIHNNLLSITDPLGRVTSFQYNDRGDRIVTTLPAVFNPESGQLENSVSRASHNPRGQVQITTDPTTKQQINTYHTTEGGYLTSSRINDDNGRSYTTNYNYNNAAERISATDPRGFTTTFEHNVHGQVTKTIAPESIDLVVESIYDKLSREIEKRRGPAQSLSLVSKSTYNEMGKISTFTSADGATQSYAYSLHDQLIETTDAINRKSATVYDDLGLVEQTRLAVGTDLEQTYQTNTYTANGMPESVTDAAGNVTRYEYDSFDRLFRVYYPSPTLIGQVNSADYSELLYDQLGNIIQQRTRAGTLINFTFDDQNRLMEKRVSGSSPRKTQYYYDLAGRLLEVTTDDGQSIKHTYSRAGRLLNVESTLPSGRTYNVQYEYDLSGNRSAVIWNDGYTVNYETDALNRITSVKENNEALLARYEYDALSRRKAINYGNAISTTFSHELDNVLSKLEHNFGVENIVFDYSYDLANQMRSTSVSDPLLLGGPASTQDTTYTSNGLNQYTSISNEDVTFDDNGNLTSFTLNGQDYQFSFNDENLLVKAITPGFTTEYQYNHLNQRVSKNINDGDTIVEYLYQGDELIAEYNGKDGTLIRRYVYGPGVDERIAVVTPDNKKQYFHLNHQGSTIATSNDAGEIITKIAYTPFGLSNANLLENPYGYTGRYFDWESGLYYYRARYYSPLLGRFLQPDPIGYEDNMNMYTYVANSPLYFTDPTGLEAKPLHDAHVQDNISHFSGKSDHVSLFSFSNVSKFTHEVSDTSSFIFNETILGSATATLYFNASYHVSNVISVVTSSAAYLDNKIGAGVSAIETALPANVSIPPKLARGNLYFSVASFADEYIQKARSSNYRLYAYYANNTSTLVKNTFSDK